MNQTQRAALPSGVAALLAGVVPGGAEVAVPLRARAAMLAAYVDVLLPDDGLTPAASALDVQGAILALAEASEPLARMIGLVGDWLDTLGPGGFAGLPEGDRAAVVDALAASDPDALEGRFHLLVRLLAIEVYYAHPRALAGLDLAPAPQPAGYPPPWR